MGLIIVTLLKIEEMCSWLT